MNIAFEAKYAARLLRKTPIYTGICLAVMTFSITISIIVFSLIYHFSLKPMDFFESERWYIAEYYSPQLRTVLGPTSINGFTYQNLLEDSYQSFETKSGFEIGSATFSDGTVSLSLPANFMSLELMDAIELAPYLGRRLGPQDVNENVVVIGHDTWKNYYGSNENIVGQTTRINSETHTIVGVLEPGFSFILGGADFWLPLDTSRFTLPSTNKTIAPLFKLRDGVSINAAHIELATAFARIREQYPDIYTEDYELRLVPLKKIGVEGAASFFTSLTIVALILILLGCLNIGTLLFARILERRKELAIRNALGSSLGQLLRQSLLETFILCAIAFVLSLISSGLAFGGINAAVGESFASAGRNVTTQWMMQIDGLTIAFAILVACSVWLISSVFPSYRATKQDIALALASGAKQSTTTQSLKTTSILVGFQVVFACFLLILSGYLSSTLTLATKATYGLNPENIVTGYIDLSELEFNEIDSRTYLNDISAQISEHTSLESIGLSSFLPPANPLPLNSFQLVGANSSPESEFPTLVSVAISKNYFDLLDINLVQGRFFDSNDNEDSLAVAVIDEYLANQYWPDENAIGKQITLNPSRTPEVVTIVGISQHVEAKMPQLPDDQFFLYRPYQQNVPSAVQLLAKTDSDIPRVKMQIAESAQAVNRDIPVSNIKTLQDYFAATWGATAIISNLFTAVALITLAISAAGIFAVMTRTIIQHTHDIGVRRALGSSNATIIWLFLRKGISFLLLGNTLGIGFAILVGNALFGQFTQDPLSGMTPIIFTVFITLSVVILLASYIPTRRAIRYEPGDALRID